jgi:hypothetical protein
VFISRFSPIWLIWLGLLNLSLALYVQLYFLEDTVFLLLGLSSFLCMLIWSLCQDKFTFLNKAWATCLLFVFATYMATSNALIAIFDSSILHFLQWLLYLIITGVLFYSIKRNIFALACACVSAIIVANSLIIRGFDFDAASFFICGLLTLIMGTGSTLYLRGLAKAFVPSEHKPSNEGD